MDDWHCLFGGWEAGRYRFFPVISRGGKANGRAVRLWVSRRAALLLCVKGIELVWGIDLGSRAWTS